MDREIDLYRDRNEEIGRGGGENERMREIVSGRDRG